MPVPATKRLCETADLAHWNRVKTSYPHIFQPLRRVSLTITFSRLDSRVIHTILIRRLNRFNVLSLSKTTASISVIYKNQTPNERETNTYRRQYFTRRNLYFGSTAVVVGPCDRAKIIQGLFSTIGLSLLKLNGFNNC